MKKQFYLVLGALVWLAGCGTPGAPRPPSLRLPQTVSDLTATRVGSTVTLTWTEPERTTDGEGIRKLGSTLICMGVNDYPMTHCDQTLADLSQPQFASCAPKIGEAATCAVALPEQIQLQNPLGQATYAIEVLNTNGRSAGLSNQIRIPTAYTLPPIPEVSAKITPDAVAVEFTGYGEIPVRGNPTQGYHVFRREQSAQTFLDLGPAERKSPGDREARLPYQFFDRNFEWNKAYEYRVVAITTVSLDGKTEQIEGDPTPAVAVFTKDIFPPAAPTGLQAVASGVGQPPFVDLTWAPNTESDLAGYNVYRHEEGQVPVKINAELIKAPAYRDDQVERGHKYFYAVTAVDLRGNESGKSAEASEVVQ